VDGILPLKRIPLDMSTENRLKEDSISSVYFFLNPIGSVMERQHITHEPCHGRRGLRLVNRFDLCTRKPCHHGRNPLSIQELFLRATADDEQCRVMSMIAEKKEKFRKAKPLQNATA
jgi:hypothetical protein